MEATNWVVAICLAIGAVAFAVTDSWWVAAGFLIALALQLTVIAYDRKRER